MHDDMAVIVPHGWLASAADLPEAEALLGLGSTEAFRNSVIDDDPRLLANDGHPVLLEPGYKTKFVPVWIHGDGVEYSEDDSMLVHTCGSVLTTTNSMLATVYLAAFVKSVTAVLAKHGHDTWSAIWRVLTWSFLAAWEGKHPCVDWEGNAFPAGSKFAALAGTQLCRGFRFLIWNLIPNVLNFYHIMAFNKFSCRVLKSCNLSFIFFSS